MAEVALTGLILLRSWESAPRDMATIGVVLIALIFAYWYLVFRFGALVRGSSDGKPTDIAHMSLIVGAAIGLGGMALSFAAGPHGAVLAIFALGAQHLGLAIARMGHAA